MGLVRGSLLPFERVAVIFTMSSQPVALTGLTYARAGGKAV